MDIIDNTINDKPNKNLKIKLDDIKSIIHDLFKHSYITNNDIYDEKTFNDIREHTINLYCCYNNIEYNINDLTFNFKLEKCIEELIEKRILVDEPYYNEVDINNITKQIQFLDSIPQFEQRTEGWYEFRKQRITASDFATAIDENPYGRKKDLILKKCGLSKPFSPGAAILHGVKYEEVVCNIYSKRNDVIVKEYGCIPHPKIDWIGASPDGICSYNSNNKNYIGRMLEIKCPKSRVINGYPPEYYHIQVQGQLEVCELEYCDFLECDIRQYDNKEEFFKDVIDDKTNTKYNNNNYNRNLMEKGIIIELYDNKTKSLKFEYCPYDICKNKESILKWENNIIDNVLENEELDLEYLGTTYWKLNEYSCVLIKRDRHFWNNVYQKLKIFWNELEEYKKNKLILVNN